MDFTDGEPYTDRGVSGVNAGTDDAVSVYGGSLHEEYEPALEISDSDIENITRSSTSGSRDHNPDTADDTAGAHYNGNDSDGFVHVGQHVSGSESKDDIVSSGLDNDDEGAAVESVVSQALNSTSASNTGTVNAESKAAETNFTAGQAPVTATVSDAELELNQPGSPVDEEQQHADSQTTDGFEMLSRPVSAAIEPIFSSQEAALDKADLTDSFDLGTIAADIDEATLQETSSAIESANINDDTSKSEYLKPSPFKAGVLGKYFGNNSGILRPAGLGSGGNAPGSKGLPNAFSSASQIPVDAFGGKLSRPAFGVGSMTPRIGLSSNISSAASSQAFVPKTLDGNDNAIKSLSAHALSISQFATYKDASGESSAAANTVSGSSSPPISTSSSGASPAIQAVSVSKKGAAKKKSAKKSSK
ncbi:hypothetical protein BX661DRAFT_178688 [Kickxella alabastrina]|uniref:uncharacterized protein n=1 Tax=Kickxella alabastrina TaxID=61397 RepID=UPI00221E5548|nr:uncharacterized protein BX661DRAFT_178688 [Kickxella alabastrina]KAI7832876.1 hypothetical protein BX661DRAFT_178688 [Kickxella alabastrina]